MKLPGWAAPQKLFKATVPNLQKYIGRKVKMPSGQSIVIQTIVGNRWKPQFYEINGEHLLGMLRFHAQMEKDTSITEEQFKQFEEMVIEAEKLPENKPEPKEVEIN